MNNLTNNSKGSIIFCGIKNKGECVMEEQNIIQNEEVKANSKKYKKIIKGALALILIALLVFAGIKIYKSIPKALDSGDGKYYSQMTKGFYLQFNKDKTFLLEYDPNLDPDVKNMEEKDKGEKYTEHKGTWEEKGNEIILTYTDDSDEKGFTLKKDGNIIYNPEIIYKGKVYTESAFKGTYETKHVDGKYDSIVFFEDNTMTFDRHWGKTTTNNPGYYKRNGNIINIRYNNSANIEHPFLVLSDGIAEDIYTRGE